MRPKPIKKHLMEHVAEIPMFKLILSTVGLLVVVATLFFCVIKFTTRKKSPVTIVVTPKLSKEDMRTIKANVPKPYEWYEFERNQVSSKDIFRRFFETQSITEFHIVITKLNASATQLILQNAIRFSSKSHTNNGIDTFKQIIVVWLGEEVEKDALLANITNDPADAVATIEFRYL